VTGSEPSAWNFAFTEQASGVLADIRKFGSDKLHDDVVRFLQALRLEILAAIRAGKSLAGTKLKDGRYAVDVRQEGILVYYKVYPDDRRVVVTNIIWL
jgi:hypothetical protein